MAKLPAEKPTREPDPIPVEVIRENERDTYEDGSIPDLPLSHDPLGNPGPTPPEAGKEPD
ncbi:MAG: hypothetical protein ABI377_02175 [Devosia sp.]